VDKLKLQLRAAIVVVAFIAILAALVIVLGRATDAKDVGAILGPVTTAIAGLGGAFFGVNLGVQSKESAEKARDSPVEAKDKAQQRAEMYLARLPPDVGAQVQAEAQF
jgi:hypothetical protein